MTISAELPRDQAIALADKLQSAYQAGYTAGMDDLPFAGNPFELGVDERKAWNAGYEDGRDKFIAQSAASNAHV